MLTESDLRLETRAALDAVRAARSLVTERQGASEVREKAANDIVTATDVLVQNVIELVLREKMPDIAFLGEEGTPDVTHQSRRIWLVDPICGTTNYAANIPLFATNIALVEDSDVVTSVVADGGTGELYVAESGRGAWRIEPGGLRHLNVGQGYGLVSVDPDNRGGTGADDFPTAFAIEALSRRRWDVRALASTIALVYLASGRLAGAVYAPLGAAVHFAAGVLLANEAGAVVTDHTGANWNTDSPILVAAATQDLHTELLALAAKVYASVNPR